MQITKTDTVKHKSIYLAITCLIWCSQQAGLLSARESQQQEKHARIGLILDSSGSMRNSDPNDIRKKASKAIVSILNEGDEVFIVDFDEDATFLNKGYTSAGFEEVLNLAIDRINSKGGTDIGEGLDSMRAAILSSREVDFSLTGVLLLTDGLGDYHGEAGWFHQNNIPIYTVSYKQQADAALMDSLASYTGGVYIQADNEDDVVQAFTQFYHGINGSSILYRESVPADQSHETEPVYIDPTADEMIFYLSNLSFNPSAVDPGILGWITPDQQTITLADLDKVVLGGNYIFARVPLTGAGDFTFFYRPDMQTTRILPGSFTMEIAVNTRIELDVNIIETQQDYYKIEFSGKDDQIQMDQSSAEITVTPPRGDPSVYSESYKNGAIDFVPMDGKGNYRIDARFTGLDRENRRVQRYFLRSLLVGDFKPGYIGEIYRIMGNYIYTSQGLMTRNREGITAEVYKQGSDLTLAIAKGYVTEVTVDGCIIELQQIEGPLAEGDIVILDLVQWKADR